MNIRRDATFQPTQSQLKYAQLAFRVWIDGSSGSFSIPQDLFAQLMTPQLGHRQRQEQTLQTLRVLQAGIGHKDASPADKAAFISEAVMGDLPETSALAARHCVTLHWFDQPVVAALLPDVSSEQVASTYEQLTALPFIESVPGGFGYHVLTRQGLLNRYADDALDCSLL